MTLGWPEGVHAATMELTFRSIDSRSTRIIPHDLRVQGQSPELAAYVAELRFPAAGAAQRF